MIVIEVYPTVIYLFKVTMETPEQCLKFVLGNNKDMERRRWRRSGFFIINFEQISNIVLLL